MKGEQYAKLRPESEREQPDSAIIQEHYKDDKLVGYTWIVYGGSHSGMTGPDYRTFEEAAEHCAKETGAGPFPSADKLRADTPLGTDESGEAFLGVSEWRNPESKKDTAN